MLSPLFPLKTNINTMAYNGILEYCVLPTELCDNSLGRSIFCSNMTVPMHKARSMKEWFTEPGIKELKLRPEPYWATVSQLPVPNIIAWHYFCSHSNESMSPQQCSSIKWKAFPKEFKSTYYCLGGHILLAILYSVFSYIFNSSLFCKILGIVVSWHVLCCECDGYKPWLALFSQHPPANYTGISIAALIPPWGGDRSPNISLRSH